MNWYACCAAGTGHPAIPEANIEEMTDRTPLRELPHFREVMRRGQPRVGGVWALYSELVSRSV
ncbi:MAG TPA: hypothetical protein VIB47_01345, partial [Dehalococcoidia bacterium]